MDLPADDLDRIEQALGWRPTDWRRASPGRGTSEAASRWIVRSGDRSAFVKVGATPVTAGLFRRERQNYATIRAPFMPQFLGYFDDGHRPVLALEDCSDAYWPPPWQPGQVELVIDALRELHGMQPPSHVERLTNDDSGAWRKVGADPTRWATLGVCSAGWLERVVEPLDEAAARAPLAGEALVHLDVRSDNVGFRDGRPILVDWPEAAAANPDLDLAFWLPSLHFDGGPEPESILPDAPELAAWVAGFFFSRAALPPIPDAPHVRPLQLAQSRTALPWAARALGLPPPV